MLLFSSDFDSDTTTSVILAFPLTLSLSLPLPLLRYPALLAGLTSCIQSLLPRAPQFLAPPSTDH